MDIDKEVLEEFDASCISPEIGVKAIWLLYRWGRWSLLKSLGLSRKQVESVFEKFDDRYVESFNGRLSKPYQVEALIQIMPEVLNAAVLLIGLYMIVKGSPTLTERYKHNG